MLLPAMEGKRQWLKGDRLRFESTGHNLSLIGSLPGIEVAHQAVQKASKPPANLADYSFKTKPYEHQLRALLKIGDKKTFGLFMEQGTGKTKVIIDWAGHLYGVGKITGILVVSKKGVHRQWIESEFPKHCGIEFDGNFFWNNKSPEFHGAGLQAFAINYEGVYSVHGQAAVQAFIRRHHGKLLVVADESQAIKEPQTRRHKALAKVTAGGAAPYRALVTGTPIARDLVDEWGQLKWLNSDIIGIKYLTTFRREYCIMGGFQMREVVGPRNLERFKTLTAPWIFRATKDEIGILPKQYSEWFFDLSDEQKAAMKQLKRDFLLSIEGKTVVEAIYATTVMIKMQQVSNGFVLDENTKVHLLKNNPRIEAARDWLNSFEGKALIWCRFRQDIELVSQMLEADKQSFVIYHGGVNDADRKMAVESFLDVNGSRVLLANPQTAGVGLNLQGLCNNALYYSNAFNYIDRVQSEDRIHRIGTKGAVVYTDLIGKGSIDKRILANLQQKKSLSDLVLTPDSLKEFFKEV